MEFPNPNKLSKHIQKEVLKTEKSVRQYIDDTLKENDTPHNLYSKTLDKYSDTFGLDLTKCTLKASEYGNNLFLNDFSNYNVDDIILNTHCVKRKMFNCSGGIETSLISGTSNTEVRIKFYSKSADYPKHCDNVLRAEDKPTKVRGLNAKGIIYVSDLYNIKNHIILLEKHLENMSKIVLYDYTMNIPKNSKYAKEAKEFRNSIYWRRLIKHCKENKEYYTKYNDKVNLLNKLSKKYGADMLQVLMQQSKNQSLKALGVCNFSEFQIIRTPKNARLMKPKNAQLYIRCIVYPYTINRYQINNSKKASKKCIVTGLDISTQRANSFLLSIKSIKKLYNTDKSTYNRIKNKYLSKKWINADTETQFKEIYHNIRNAHSNSRIKQKRIYQPHHLTLFNLDN